MKYQIRFLYILLLKILYTLEWINIKADGFNMYLSSVAMWLKYLIVFKNFVIT